MIIYALSFLSLLSVLGISFGPFSGFTHHFTNPLVQKTVEQRALDIKLMKSVGAVWVREGIYWEEFEKEPGVYDFGKISPVIEQYEEAGIKVLGLFGYSNSLYAEHKFHFTSLAEDVELPAGYTETEYIAERFAAAFFAVMQQFPYITHFQILNEMNGGKHFKAGSNYIEIYRRLLAAVFFWAAGRQTGWRPYPDRIFIICMMYWQFIPIVIPILCLSICSGVKNSVTGWNQ
jgi:hypothetical protein